MIDMNEYKRLRAKGLTSESALRQARQVARAKAAWRLCYGEWCIEGTNYDSNSGPYGGYRCRTSDGLPPWLDRAAREAGWDPAHLSVRITADVDTWYDGIDVQLPHMGFDLVKAKGVYPSRKRRGEFEYDAYELNKPEPHSVLVDLSGPRDRSDRHWLTYTDECMGWGKPTGMSKSVEADWEHRFRLEQAKRMAEWARKCFHEEIQPYSVVVEILWRGEVVGEAACGGFELEWRGSFDGGPTFEEQVLDIVGESLFDEAWDNAQDWAEAAVSDAKAQAAAIIESIALLPEAAHRAVREEFDRKVINMTAKKEA